MPRTALTLLLIPGVLLTQFAAVPHVHGADCGQDSTHDLRPHFHFHHLNPANSVRGSVVHCCAGSSLTAPTTSAAEGDAPQNHDADAVYVEVCAGTSDHDNHKCTWFGTSIVYPVPLDFLVCVVTRSAPPPAAGAAKTCPLYVRHLALII